MEKEKTQKAPRPAPASVVKLRSAVEKAMAGGGGARVEAQKAANAQLKTRNDKLSAEVEDLKQGSEAIEERARSELGLVKPGETFYRVVDPHSGGAAADGKRDAGDE